MGATWAPFKDGKTTLRVSWGVFYDWLQTNTYEQTVRIDGFRQREINVAAPSYPEPPLTIAGVTPADRYLLDPALKHPKQLARQRRCRLRVFTTLSRECDVSLHARRGHVPRPEPECAGQRTFGPIPEFGNVIQVVGDGRMRQHVWNFGGQTNFPQELGRTATKLGLQALQFLRQLLAGLERKQHRWPFQRSRDRKPRWRVGERQFSREAPLFRRIFDPGLQGRQPPGQHQWSSRDRIRHANGIR